MSSNANALEEGFVYLAKVNPNIVVDLRYANTLNFLNQPVQGYHKNVAIMTHEAALALTEAEAILNKQGYALVLYDAYRPQKAVQHFVSWSKTSDEAAKLAFYPRVNKPDFFKLGYVSNESAHCRGSTVDVSIIKIGARLHAPRSVPRTLPDGAIYIYLEDGTIDMGTAFDFFDVLSWPESTEISHAAQKNRQILSYAMKEAGFVPISTEWWHFTLNNEPFPNTAFDFNVE